jgi:hypothetical protein
MAHLRSKAFATSGDVRTFPNGRTEIAGSALDFEDAGGHRLKGLPGVRKAFRLASVETDA